MQPVNFRLILQPSDSAMRGTIFVPDQYKDAATSCLVISKCPKVSHYIKEGEVVLCEVGFGDRTAGHFPGTRNFWAKESNIYAVLKNNIIYPLGRKVLLKRCIEDIEVGGIIVPENRRYQSLDAWIVRLGLTRDHFRVNGLTPGTKIRLEEWKEHMIAVTLEDGSYGLIVNENDIALRYESELK